MTLAAVVTVGLVMVTGACTLDAPVATTSATTRASVHDGRLFPLVRDAPEGKGTTTRRVGFVDDSGRVVVRPTYRASQHCPTADGADVLLAWGDGHLDALGAKGAVSSTLVPTETSTPGVYAEVTSVVCGPLPGYVTVGTDQGLSIGTLPDLATADLPAGVGLDPSVVWVPAGQGGPTASLYDATTSTTIPVPADAASPALDRATGEWPVPVRDTRGRLRYLAKTGAWASTQMFAQAGGFVDGHGWVSTGTSWHFVDTTLTPTGRDFTGIVPLLASDGSVTGYQVTSAAGGARTGLVGVDLTVVVDPDAESAVCTASPAGGKTATTCVASAADGTARLVALPAGTSTPLPAGMTTPLSDRLVTDAAGSAVHNLTTGQTFEVPASFHAESGWADSYVVVASDNGLRAVLDAAGKATAVGTITGQVAAADGTSYFWATTRTRQGYVDAAGTWLFKESRFIALVD